jgi:hypothetical protein
VKSAGGASAKEVALARWPTARRAKATVDCILDVNNVTGIPSRPCFLLNCYRGEGQPLALYIYRDGVNQEGLTLYEKFDVEIDSGICSSGGVLPIGGLLTIALPAGLLLG